MKMGKIISPLLQENVFYIEKNLYVKSKTFVIYLKQVYDLITIENMSPTLCHM